MENFAGVLFIDFKLECTIFQYKSEVKHNDTSLNTPLESGVVTSTKENKGSVKERGSTKEKVASVKEKAASVKEKAASVKEKAASVKEAK